MSLKIVDPQGDPTNDEGNYPLDTEAALEWCITKLARIEFRRSALERTPYVVISLRSGYTATKATFIEAVEDLQRKLREQP